MSRVNKSFFAAMTMSLPMITWAVGALGQGSMDVAQAEVLYNEANKLMTAKQYEQACPKFAESHRLDPGIGTLLKLATCYENLDKTASAWATLLEAEALAQKKKDDRESKARARAEQMVPKLTRMNVVVPNAVASISGLEVRRDGALIGKGQWGQALPIDPGTYQIEVTAPGKQTWTTRIEVSGRGKTIPVEIPMLQPVPVQAPPPVPQEKKDKTSPNETKTNAQEKDKTPPVETKMNVQEKPSGPSAVYSDSSFSGTDPKPDQLPEPRTSHAGQLGAFFRADVDGKFRGQVSVFGLSYGLGNHIDVAAGALVGKDKGIWAGATAYLLQGKVKPRLTLGTHLFFADGVQFGLHGAGGLQWDPIRHLGLFLDAGVSYWPSPRPNYEKLVFVPSVGVQGRL